jgi:hypothetical protein
MRPKSLEEQQQNFRIPESSTLPKKEQIRESLSNPIVVTKTEQWIAIALCAVVLVVWAFEHLIHYTPVESKTFAPVWLPLAASAFTLMGIIRLNGSPKWIRVQRMLVWIGLLLMVWLANGLLFDFLKMANLIGDPATGLRIGVNWPGMMTRILALGIAIVLGRISLSLPTSPSSTRSAIWYGYAAFVFALPYPFLRIWWALGGKAGLINAGASGHGSAPLLLSIPWMIAAILSLLLVSPPRWMPRRLLLVTGWSGTAIVASIAPSACWSLITKLASGDSIGSENMETWVFCLFYISWLFWALAAGAATRSYQLRTASSPDVQQNMTDLQDD